MKKNVVAIDEGLKLGLRSTKFAVPNGQAMVEMKGLCACDDGAVYPNYDDLPTTLKTNMTAAGIITTISEWPFPQFFKTSRHLILVGNTATEGRVYYVNTSTWALTQITPFTYLQDRTDTHPAFSPFTAAFHIADFWTTWYLTNGVVTIFIGGGVPYADSASYALSGANPISPAPYLGINTLLGHRGSLYMGGFTPNATWLTTVAADRRNTSSTTSTSLALDFVWKSMTGGGNTLSLIVPAMGYATQLAASQTFAAGWTASGSGWTFGVYTGSSISQVIAGVAASILYKVAVELEFGDATSTFQATLGTGETVLLEASEYGVGTRIRLAALVTAESNVLTLVCTGTGTMYRVALTDAFSLEDDQMRLDTGQISLPTGEVRQLCNTRKSVIALCEHGICSVALSAGPVLLGNEKLTDVGVVSRNSGASGKDEVIAIGNTQSLIRISGDLRVKEFEHVWYADWALCNTIFNMATYDSVNDEYRISDVDKGLPYTFVISSTGTAQVYNVVSSMFMLSGTMYQRYVAVAPDPSDTFEILTDMMDFGMQIKSGLVGVEIGSHDVSAVTITIQAYMNGAFIPTASSPLGPDGIAMLSVVTNKARIHVTGTMDSPSAKIAAIRIHFVGGDERFG